MIRVLLADDHAIIRDGLKTILSSVGDMTVAGEASDGEETLALSRTLKADVIVLDISMPGKSGIALIQHLKSTSAAEILVLSMHPESQYALQALRAGAAGYITKNAAATQLIDGIRAVAQGQTYVSRDLAGRLVREVQQSGTARRHEQLTPREFQILHMLVDGSDINSIARALSLSNKTISTHKANLQRKLDVSSTAGLVHYAVRHGLFGAGEPPRDATPANA
jgi:DNA-binding NarL/FixJ family response regulator